MSSGCPEYSPSLMLRMGLTRLWQGRAREGSDDIIVARDKITRFYLVIGGILLAVGLWDLFFVLFRSEDVLFTLSAALLLLLGSLNIWQGITRLRTQRPGV
jgi:hypothetical protein